MRLSVNRVLPLAALVFCSACAAVGGNRPAPAPALPTSGPGADYPVVVGEPFTIGSVTYEPVDTLNYDAVGYAMVSDSQDTRITAAHKTLPLPSYAEVTDLDSGRTILLRVESRGPMVNNRLIELSPGAARQLGLSEAGAAPVRVRRVNPPEQERAMLRQGEQAPLRMETPPALRDVLKRKLDTDEPLSPPGGVVNPPVPSMTAQDPDLAAWVARPEQPAAEPPKSPETAPQPTASRPDPAEVAQAGEYVVQAAAFSTKARADAAAAAIGGYVTKPGRYWYLRLGPFATQADAQAALEKAKGKGYSDARIQRAD